MHTELRIVMATVEAIIIQYIGKTSIVLQCRRPGSGREADFLRQLIQCKDMLGRHGLRASLEIWRYVGVADTERACNTHGG